MIQEQDLNYYLSSTQGLSRGTIVGRRSSIRIFYQWFLENEKEINAKTIEKFLYYLREKGRSNTTRNGYLVALRSLEKYLINRKLVSKRFMKGFSNYPEEDPDIIPLNPDEISLLKEACQEESPNRLEQTRRNMLVYLIDSGVRFNDAQNLKVKNVNVTTREVTFNQLKTGKRMVIYMDDYLLSRLAERVANKSPDSLVFTNSVGGVMYRPDYHMWLKHFAHRVGITKRVSPHIFRHSYGQNGYDKTGDIYLVKDMLGHKKIKSTIRYAKNSTEKVKRAQKLHPHVSNNLPLYERKKIFRERSFKNLEELAHSSEEEKELIESLNVYA